MTWLPQVGALYEALVNCDFDDAPVFKGDTFLVVEARKLINSAYCNIKAMTERGEVSIYISKDDVKEL